MSSRIIIFSSLLLLAFLLQAIPVSSMVAEFSISWVLLITIIWQLSIPRSLPILLVIFLGLLMDVQTSSLLGAHVASLSLILVLISGQQKRFRMFSIIQQMVMVFILVFIHQLALLLMTWGISDKHFSLSLWQPALISSLVWPWLSVIILAKFQRIR